MLSISLSFTFTGSLIATGSLSYRVFFWNPFLTASGFLRLELSFGDFWIYLLGPFLETIPDLYGLVLELKGLFLGGDGI